jgi:type IV secretion system protein VirB9
MLNREAPVLFVLASSGDVQVVNYRVRNDYYVVDRLFERAELRLGQKDQEIVRIARDR